MPSPEPRGGHEAASRMLSRDRLRRQRAPHAPVVQKQEAAPQPPSQRGSDVGRRMLFPGAQPSTSALGSLGY